jgi:hypothetical protein
MTAAHPHPAKPYADEALHKQITEHVGTDWEDVRAALSTSLHGRPLSTQKILDQATKDLEQKGILPPGSHLLAPAGDDFRVKDSKGGVDVVNPKNMQQMHAEAAAGSVKSTIGKRDANIDADGAGTVRAEAKDQRRWNLAQDALKAQGISNPTPNQMANWEMQFVHDNHLHSIRDVKPGHEYKLPEKTLSSDREKGTTQFTAENAQAKYDAAVTPVQQALDAFKQFSQYGGLMGTTHLTKEQIDAALKQDKVPGDSRAGLEWMRDNFDMLSHSGWKNGGDDGGVSELSLKRAQKKIKADAQKQRETDEFDNGLF